MIFDLKGDQMINFAKIGNFWDPSSVFIVIGMICSGDSFTMK